VARNEQRSADQNSDNRSASSRDPDSEARSPGLPGDSEPEADGYKQTRRQVARGDKPAPAKSKAPAGPPPTKYQQFMEQHWDGWLSQVLLIVLLGVGVIAYKADMLRESVVGLLLAGGLVATAIYATAVPAYDLIQSQTGRRLFSLLVIVWVAAAGYPTLRKGMARKDLATAVLTEDNKTAKLTIGEGQIGPFDMTVSGSLKPEARQESHVGYELTLTGEGGVQAEESGEFTAVTHQGRVRRGSTHWTEERNQVEHRLPGNLRGKELTVTTEHVDDMLQSGLHISIHPQSMNPNWFFIAGALVVLAMMYVETKIGDSKTKPHLIMASLGTLMFSWRFHEIATINRMVAPSLDALLAAVCVGGIGGTMIGAVVRRASGRDRIKPAVEDDKADKDA
jgi:hypothetical protein